MLADYEVTSAVVLFEEVDDLILGIDWLAATTAGGRLLRISSKSMERL